MLCAKVIVLNLLTVRNKQSKTSDVTQRLLLLHFLSYAFVIHPTVTTNQIWFSHDGLREIKTKIHPDSDLQRHTGKKIEQSGDTVCQTIAHWPLHSHFWKHSTV